MAWLVSRGSYSDYKPLAVFTSKDDAEEASKRLGASNAVKWIPLDEHPPLINGGYAWRVEFDPDGDIVYSEMYSTIEFIEYGLNQRRQAHVKRDGSVACAASGATLQDAIKSASDTRRMALASGVVGRWNET